MSDDQDRLLRQLEQATAREPADDEQLDAETERLREGWLAMSRLLEMAEMEVDQQSIVAPIERIERKRTMRRVAAGLMAVAASLLIVASAIRFLSDRETPSIRAQPKQIATPRQQRSPATTTDEATDDIEFAWDDSLDDQFAQVTRSISEFNSPSYLDDLSFDVLDDQLQRLGQNINEL